jgi:quinol monooxygenase YgiN
MLIVHVHIRVKPGLVDDFRAATLENARNSAREPGIARFDVLQNEEDPNQFLLVEIYRTPAAPAQHKETSHYQAWRDRVADMMAEPRTSVKFHNLFPADPDW